MGSSLGQGSAEDPLCYCGQGSASELLPTVVRVTNGPPLLRQRSGDAAHQQELGKQALGERSYHKDGGGEGGATGKENSRLGLPPWIPCESQVIWWPGMHVTGHTTQND